MTKFHFILISAVLLAVPGIASADIVYNGGFETGDFTGWILSGNPIPGIVDNLNPNTGQFAANLYAADSLGYIEQILPTSPGTSYTLTYFLESDGGVPSEFVAMINGSSIFDSMNIPAQSYTRYSFSFQAAGATTDIKFGFRNDPGSFYLDDIAVNAVPEPALAWAVAFVIGLTIAARAKFSRKESI